MDESEFERCVLEAFGTAVDDYFYSKIAGGKHRNADGTYRSRIIRECEQFEILDLEPEPQNAYDAHAIKVLRRKTGEQLGYLPSRTAMDLPRQTDPGTAWIALLKEHNVSPETGRVVGANIMLLRWNEEKYRAQQEPPPPRTKEERWAQVKRERAERLAAQGAGTARGPEVRAAANDAPRAPGARPGGAYRAANLFGRLARAFLRPLRF